VTTIRAPHEAVATVAEDEHRDRFGNEHAPGLPYARGLMLASTEDDFRKLQQAWRHMEARIAAGGAGAVFNFSGLEHGLPLAPDELPLANDFVAPALYFERFRAAAVAHFGGSLDRHDAALFNRLTGATLATHLTLASPDDVVIGVSESHSHASVVRASARIGSRLVEAKGVGAFEEALAREPEVALVVLTRLAVTYDLMPLDHVRAVIEMSHSRGIPVYVDDAGGARVGPALGGQPGVLELGADVVGTGLDKYGVTGPRLGVLAGEAELVSRIRARGFELGLEARPLLYPAAVRSLEGSTPERVLELRDTSAAVAAALRARVGNRVQESEIIAQMLAEDILELALERAGLTQAPIVPYEATSAHAMLLVRDHGAITVQLVGLPPGTSSLMLKFIAPEELDRFGGAEAYAEAIDEGIDKLAGLLTKPDGLRQLLFGS
jgi:L-seryl-tRNA(Ser) seleniumtransferase